jgi:hypothetical protein
MTEESYIPQTRRFSVESISDGCSAARLGDRRCSPHANFADDGVKDGMVRTTGRRGEEPSVDHACNA